MEQIFLRLSSFFDQEVQFILSEDDFFEGETFEIYENGNEDMLGICVVNSDEQIIVYHYLGMYEKGVLMSEDMPAIAEEFIRTLYPSGLEKYELQSVVDLEDVFLVTYGSKDEKFGLELPGIGFSLTISTSGKVVQFNYDEEQANICYPKSMISNQEAKERYAALIDFELVICRLDSEIYPNGENTYRLVYTIKEAAVDIPASGNEPISVAEGNQYKQIELQSKPDKSFYELIGITTDHIKLGELVHEDCLIEKWIHSSMERPDEIDFMEAYTDQMITIHFDLETKMPTMVYNGESYKVVTERLDETIQQQRALDFLFTLFPQANEKFMGEIDEFEEEEWMEELDEDEIEELDEDEMEELDEIGEEESTPFYFQYHIDGVLVEENVTCIQVGVYSGNIISASVEPVDESLLTGIQTAPLLSKDEARSQLMRKLHMELSMSQEYDEDGKAFYQPVYLPSYPETIGHIQMIDATNGKAYYVDVGDSIFS